MKHTQGNWLVANSGGSVICHNGERYISVALLEKSTLLITPEIEANAKLIASAPDLLQTLIELRQYLNPDDYAHKDGIIEKIDNAIKKATE